MFATVTVVAYLVDSIRKREKEIKNEDVLAERRSELAVACRALWKNAARAWRLILVTLRYVYVVYEPVLHRQQENTYGERFIYPSRELAYDSADCGDESNKLVQPF